MRVAIAGAAHPHVQYLLDEVRSRPELQLVGVFDADLSLSAPIAEEFEAASFTQLDDLLAQAPEVVYVAGVYADHAEATIAGLAAGCHVLVDKPLCTTLADLDRIEQAAATATGVLSLLLEKRYYSPTRALLALHTEGVLGEVVGITSLGPHKLNPTTRPGWFFDRARYGGLLNDLAVHDLDLALLLMDDPSARVRGVIPTSGAGTSTGLAVQQAPWPRFGHATLATDAAIASCHVDWLTPAGSAVHGDYQMRVIGTRGVAEVFWAQNRLVLTTDEAPSHEVELPAASRPAELVIDALLAGRTPDVTAAASIRATRAALLAQHSADTDGGWQPLDPVR